MRKDGQPKPQRDNAPLRRAGEVDERLLDDVVAVRIGAEPHQVLGERGRDHFHLARRAALLDDLLHRARAVERAGGIDELLRSQRAQHSVAPRLVGVGARQHLLKDVVAARVVHERDEDRHHLRDDDLPRRVILRDPHYACPDLSLKQTPPPRVDAHRANTMMQIVGREQRDGDRIVLRAALRVAPTSAAAVVFRASAATATALAAATSAAAVVFRAAAVVFRASAATVTARPPTRRRRRRRRCRRRWAAGGGGGGGRTAATARTAAAAAPRTAACASCTAPAAAAAGGGSTPAAAPS